MEIIKEYRRLIELIAVVKSKIASAQRDYERAVSAYAPAGIKGIDYSQDRVQSSGAYIDIMTVAEDIVRLQLEMAELKSELEALQRQRQGLQDTIDRLGDPKKQIISYRIDGLTLNQIAWKMGYSKRQVERLHSEIKKDVGEMSV